MWVCTQRSTCAVRMYCACNRRRASVIVYWVKLISDSCTSDWVTEGNYWQHTHIELPRINMHLHCSSILYYNVCPGHTCTHAHTTGVRLLCTPTFCDRLGTRAVSCTVTTRAVMSWQPSATELPDQLCSWLWLHYITWLFLTVAPSFLLLFPVNCSSVT